MGRVAECTTGECRGSLAPMLDKKGKPTSYYCEACGTVYEDIETEQGVPKGVRPKGRVDEQDSLRKQAESYQQQIEMYERKLTAIQEAVLGNESDLAIEIQDILNETAKETKAPQGTPKPKVDEPAE